MKSQIVLGDCIIEYELVRKNVKNINLRIHPDMSIHVSANRRVSTDTIEKMMLERQDFILTVLQKYKTAAESKPSPLQFNDDEHLNFFGKDYTIKVLQSDSNNVTLTDSKLIINVSNTYDYDLKKSVIESFIYNEFSNTVHLYCDEAYQKFKVYGIAFPQIKLKNMKSRWGSCNYAKVIVTFNTRLYEYPKECTELVVYHEFTHFLQHDHSAKFYEKLSSFLPDWKERSKILNSKGK